MSGQPPNVELIKSAYAAFTRGDLQTILDLCSEDLDFQHPMPQTIWPWAGKRKGRTGLAEFIVGLGDTIEYPQFEPREFIASGDQSCGAFVRTGSSQSNRYRVRQLLCARFQVPRGQGVAIPDFRRYCSGHRRAAGLPKVARRRR